MEQHRKKRAGDRNDGAAIGGRGPAAMMAIDGGKQQRALCGRTRSPAQAGLRTRISHRIGAGRPAGRGAR
jgi:ribosomal protein S6E (S10)